MQISVIIPTLNRPEDLRETLDTIVTQTVKPAEIIIVDQSEDNRTKRVCEAFYPGLKIKYLKQREKSLTKARNRGMKESKGDIIVFIDDDVSLERNYFEEMLKSYEDEDVIGVAGVHKQEKTGGCFTRAVKTTQEVLYWLAETVMRRIIEKRALMEESLNNLLFRLSKLPQKGAPAVSFIGHNMSFRRKAIEKYGVNFDEKMLRYCYGEDFDFSHMIYMRKKKDEKLIINPNMRVNHRESKINRMKKRELIEMVLAHTAYLSVKHYRHNRWRIIMLLSAKLARYYYDAIISGSPKMLKESTQAYVRTLRRLKYIENMDLRKVNSEIFDMWQEKDEE